MHRSVACRTPPRGDLAHDLGTCLDRGSNQRPFSLQARGQPSEPLESGPSAASLNKEGPVWMVFSLLQALMWATRHYCPAFTGVSVLDMASHATCSVRRYCELWFPLTFDTSHRRPTVLEFPGAEGVSLDVGMPVLKSGLAQNGWSPYQRKSRDWI